jgi:hypothetical protein
MTKENRVTGKGKSMKTDKGQFDEVLRRMIEKNPKKTAEIAAQNQHDGRTRNFRRKKNPETDPVKLAIGVDEAPPMELTPEEREQVRLTDELDREYREKQKN